MATTYTTLLKLAKPTQGELDGSWGTTVNDNITSMVEEAIAGRSVINSWSSNSHTLTTADGTTAESRAAMLSLTDSGDQLGTNAATVVCPALSKIYIVKNAVGQAATLKTASGTGVAIPNGKTMILFCDGTNVEEAINNVTGTLTTAAITASGVVSVDDTTDTTSGTTGSIHTDGGVGVAKALYVGTTAKIIGVTTHGDDVVSDTDSTDDLGTTSVRWANLFVDGITATDQVTATGFTGTLDGILGSGSAAAATVTTLVASGIVSVDDTTTSTSGTTGSIHTDGGLGVAGTAFVAGAAKIVGVTTHGDDVVSDTDSTDDLGTTGVRWRALYVDAITATDQITATGFTGTLDGILGSGTPAAATVTSLTLTTDLAVAHGGTGASTLTDGGILLGSGTGAITAMSVLSDGQMIVGDGTTDPVAESGATLRTSIGVGTGDSPQFTAINVGAASDTTIARSGAGDITVEGNAVYRAGGTDVPVADGGTGASTLTDGGILLGSGTGAITAMAVLADSEMIVGDGTTDPVAESGATLRTSIGVDAAGTDNSTNVTLAGTPDYITISGQTITRGAVVLTTDISGTLPIANGGTNATSAGAALTALGAAALGANSDITSLTGLTTDLTVAQGGTGAGTFAANGILYGAGTGAITATAVGTATHVLTSNGAGVAPTFQAAGGGGGVAADDITAGDAAVLLTTSSGNITVDAAASDSDIIFKGTDGGVDTTFATMDGSAAGHLILNNGSSTTTLGTSNYIAGLNAGNAIVSGGNYNIFIGENAGTATTTGDNSVAIGKDALLDLTTGGDNTAVGYLAGQNITTGTRNVVLGSGSGNGALGTATTATDNVAIGYDVLRSATGARNTAVGSSAMYTSGNGQDNVAVGNSAMYNSVSAHWNVAVGRDALYSNTTADYNTALGYNTLYSNTTGHSNVAVGNNALYANTTASYNIAIGRIALDANTTGSSNVAIGYDALGANTTGNYNHAVGLQALMSNTTGQKNDALGYGALTANITGDYNVAVGFSALGANTASDSITAIGYEALVACTGAQNTALGYQAGNALTTGTACTFLGDGTDASAVDATNQIVIGSGVTGTANDQVSIGKASNIVSNDFGTDATWTRSSDVRKKKNIADAVLGLGFINDLRPVTYEWKPNYDFPKDFSEYSEENHMTLDVTMHGLVAQEVKEALDKTGVERFAGWSEGADGCQRISAEAFVFPLIKAIQELTAKVAELEEKLNG